MAEVEKAAEKAKETIKKAPLWAIGLVVLLVLVVVIVWFVGKGEKK